VRACVILVSRRSLFPIPAVSQLKITHTVAIFSHEDDRGSVVITPLSKSNKFMLKISRPVIMHFQSRSIPTPGPIRSPNWPTDSTFNQGSESALGGDLGLDTWAWIGAQLSFFHFSYLSWWKNRHVVNIPKEPQANSQEKICAAPKSVH
jgi:hypothetical protein